jgi:hypothetical protein
MNPTPEDIATVLARARHGRMIEFGSQHSAGFQVTGPDDGSGPVEVRWWPSSAGSTHEGDRREEMLAGYVRTIRAAGYTVSPAAAGWLVVTAKEGTS